MNPEALSFDDIFSHVSTNTLNSHGSVRARENRIVDVRERNPNSFPLSRTPGDGVSLLRESGSSSLPLSNRMSSHRSPQPQSEVQGMEPDSSFHDSLLSRLRAQSEWVSRSRGWNPKEAKLIQNIFRETQAQTTIPSSLNPRKIYSRSSLWERTHAAVSSWLKSWIRPSCGNDLVKFQEESRPTTEIDYILDDSASSSTTRSGSVLVWIALLLASINLLWEFWHRDIRATYAASLFDAYSDVDDFPMGLSDRTLQASSRLPMRYGNEGIV